MFAHQVRPVFGRRTTLQESKVNTVIYVKSDIDRMLQSISEASEDHFGFGPDAYVDTSKLRQLEQVRELLRRATLIVAGL